MWLCVHKPAPWQLPFCRPEAMSPRRGFDKPPIPFPLQVGSAPKIFFRMVRSHFEDEGYSPVILPLSLCPESTRCDCNGEVRWGLNQNETCKLILSASLGLTSLLALA